MAEQGMLTDQVSRQNTLMTEQGDGRTGDADRSGIQTEHTDDRTGDVDRSGIQTEHTDDRAEGWQSKGC